MMRNRQQPIPRTNLLQALAEFRFHLRSFLQFSEQVARKQRLHPRQHQLLLQIAGIVEGRSATINFLAERLGLRQNSVVELANRSVAEGLVRRNQDPSDRRRVILSVTAKGMRVLDALSQSHARELDEYGPQLIRTMERIKSVRNGKRRISADRRRQSAGESAQSRSRG
jgi:DNA-binding MarR family transcriptional regulator